MYYLSAEFLMGRTLTNAVHNLGLDKQYGQVGGCRPSVQPFWLCWGMGDVVAALAHCVGPSDALLHTVPRDHVPCSPPPPKRSLLPHPPSHAVPTLCHAGPARAGRHL